MEGQSYECLRVLEGHTHWVTNVIFSYDNQWVVSSSNDNTIRYWDVSEEISC